MKKLMMTMAAAILISATATAQNEEQGQRPEKKFDKTEMVKHRTDEMVKRYKLNDKQAKQLLDLNTKYADKMRPQGPRPPRGPQGGPDRPPQGDKDGNAQRPEPPKDGQHPDHHKDGEHQAHRQQMEETMKAYNAELQKIMTPDQFKAYQADMQKRHEHQGHQGHPGQHGQHGHNR